MDVIDVERQLQELRQLPVAEPRPIDELAGRGQRQREKRRRVEFVAGAVAAGALVVFGLIVRTDRPQDDAVVVSGATASRPATSGPTTTLSAEDALALWDESMVAELEAFALRPSDETFNDLPLAQFVMLGIEDRIVVAKPQEELRDPSVWVVEGHSVLDQLAAGGDYVLRRNTHETCVGEENPAPLEMSGYQRLSIHPADLQNDTCLNWYSVDLFLHDGQIVGITLTLWEY